MFPVVRKRRVDKSSVKTTEEVPCLLPELPGDRMIECTVCKEYHLYTCRYMFFCIPNYYTRVDKSVPWLCYRCL